MNKADRYNIFIKPRGVSFYSGSGEMFQKMAEQGAKQGISKY